MAAWTRPRATRNNHASLLQTALVEGQCAPRTSIPGRLPLVKVDRNHDQRTGLAVTCRAEYRWHPVAPSGLAALGGVPDSPAGS
jgi:hypothetical protein